jgi:hypothetical protein
MKSIDEFATEYAQDKYLPVQTSQAVKAGANYVLEQIEEVIKWDKDPRVIEALKEKIWRLKQ